MLSPGSGAFREADYGVGDEAQPLGEGAGVLMQDKGIDQAVHDQERRRVGSDAVLRRGRRRTAAADGTATAVLSPIAASTGT
jgi:hypothetical protein